MSARSFYYTEKDIYADSSLVIFIVGWLIFCVYLVYILATTIKKNWRLLVMVIGMIIYASA